MFLYSCQDIRRTVSADTVGLSGYSKKQSLCHQHSNGKSRDQDAIVFDCVCVFVTCELTVTLTHTDDITDTNQTCRQTREIWCWENHLIRNSICSSSVCTNNRNVTSIKRLDTHREREREQCLFCCMSGRDESVLQALAGWTWLEWCHQSHNALLTSHSPGHMTSHSSSLALHYSFKRT